MFSFFHRFDQILYGLQPSVGLYAAKAFPVDVVRIAARTYGQVVAFAYSAARSFINEDPGALITSTASS